MSWLSGLYSFGDYHLRQDLFQEGAIGLLRAGKRFDPNRGAKFSTFADKHIRGRMQDFLQAELKHRSDKILSINDHSWRMTCEEGDDLDDDVPKTATECIKDIDNFLLEVELR